MEFVRKFAGDLLPEGPERTLYAGSFPDFEQRRWPDQLAALKHPDYHFCALYERDAFAGLMLYWDAGDFLYVEHFCMVPELRGKGLGRQALKVLLDQGKTVILEIDPPEDEVSIRRKGFYLRAGFHENPYPHVHPPYREGRAGHRLAVLSAPSPIDQDPYDRFRAYLENTVMRDVGRTPSVTLRVPDPSEAGAFWEMLDGLDHETEFMMYEPDERSRNLGRIESMLSAANETPGDMFVQIAEWEGHMIGFASASRDGHRRMAHSAYVVMGVRAGFRGRGVGTRLLAALTHWADANGILRLELTVDADNHPAIALYRKFGFEIEGTRRAAIRIRSAFRDEHEMARITMPREG